MIHRKIYRSLIVITILVFIAVVTIFEAGDVLSSPSRSYVGAVPVDLAAESIMLTTSSGESVSGWFSSGTSGSVLLLHGVHSDRRQMLERAKFLHNSGYSVLLIDLPAHGESSGTRITFGYREAEGVKAALRYLQQRLPQEKIAVIGVSLGAASVILSDYTPPPAAIILESMYPTIEEAITNRLHLHLGFIGSIFTPVLLSQIPFRLGISPEQLRPIDHIASTNAPLLIISGTQDQHTTSDETKRLFETALPPKELWLVEGAAHVDLYAFNPQTYETKVSAFLTKYMRY